MKAEKESGFSNYENIDKMKSRHIATIYIYAKNN